MKKAIIKSRQEGTKKIVYGSFGDKINVMEIMELRAIVFDYLRRCVYFCWNRTKKLQGFCCITCKIMLKLKLTLPTNEIKIVWIKKDICSLLG